MRSLFAYLFISLLIYSCSFKSVIVPNLDYILADRIGDELDLYYSQEKQVKKEIKQLFISHKDKIKQLRLIVEKVSVEKTRLSEVYKSFEKVYIELGTPINKLLARYVVKLDRDQRKNFYENLRKKNEKIRERLKKNNPQRYFERFEFFFGDLNKDQKQILISNEASYKTLSKERLLKREKIQSNMKKVLRDKTKNNKLKIKEIEKLFNLSLHFKMTEARKKTLSSIEKLLQSLTQKQKDHFRLKKDEILSWFDEFFEYYKN